MECDTHFLFVRQIALLEKSQMVRSMLKNDDIEKQVEKYIGCVLHVPRSIVNFVMREKHYMHFYLGYTCLACDLAQISSWDRAFLFDFLACHTPNHELANMHTTHPYISSQITHTTHIHGDSLII